MNLLDFDDVTCHAQRHTRKNAVAKNIFDDQVAQLLFMYYSDRDTQGDAPISTKITRACPGKILKEIYLDLITKLRLSTHEEWILPQ